jgi:6-pyruvoyltetrahydropterin/6-carboxytetrahydropterin synthase
MYDIKVKGSFSAAHNLRNYKGKCEHLHGHNWAVEAVFRYDILDKAGMAIDFKLAKKLLKDVTEKIDHSYLNKAKVIKGINPTSENIAKFIYDSIARKNKNIRSVSVWENENSCAIYAED